MEFLRVLITMKLLKRIEIPDDDRRKSRIKKWINLIASGAISTLSVAFPERRMWSAVRSSAWFEEIVMEHFDDCEFKEHFRINRATFFWICNKVRPYLQKKKVIREVISVERRLAVTLAKFGSSGELRNLANLFGMARSTVCIVTHETSRVIVMVFQDQVKFPDGDDVNVVVASFLGMCGLPGVCGAIGGTHIPIKAPPSCNRSDYFNREEFYSIILQGVVDHQKKFNNLNFGWPGSVPYARVFVNSKIYSLGESGYFDAFHCELPGTDETAINPYLVADPAYPLEKYLMKPFSGNLSQSQGVFNRKLNSCRILVEHSFGMLKGRWRCLLKENDSSLKNMQNIVVSCCILHNIAQELQDEYLSRWDEDHDECNDTVIFPVLPGNNAKEFQNKLLSWCDSNP